MKIIITLLLGVSIVAILAMLMALPVMLIWNYLMPDLIGFKEITIFQALLLNMLCSILFKSPITAKSE